MGKWAKGLPTWLFRRAGNFMVRLWPSPNQLLSVPWPTAWSPSNFAAPQFFPSKQRRHARGELLQNNSLGAMLWLGARSAFNMNLGHPTRAPHLRRSSKGRRTSDPHALLQWGCKYGAGPPTGILWPQSIVYVLFARLALRFVHWGGGQTRVIAMGRQNMWEYPSKQSLQSPLVHPYPETPQTQTMVWLFPLRDMVWVSSFAGKYRVWGGLSFARTMVWVSSHNVRTTGVGLDEWALKSMDQEFMVLLCSLRCETRQSDSGGHLAHSRLPNTWQDVTPKAIQQAISPTAIAWQPCPPRSWRTLRPPSLGVPWPASAQAEG